MKHIIIALALLIPIQAHAIVFRPGCQSFTAYGEMAPETPGHIHAFTPNSNTGWRTMIIIPVRSVPGCDITVRLDTDAAITVSTQTAVNGTSPRDGGSATASVFTQTGTLLIWPMINGHLYGKPHTLMSQSRNQQFEGQTPAYVGQEQATRMSAGWTFHIPACYLPTRPGVIKVGVLYQFNTHRFGSTGIAHSDASLWVYDIQETVTGD